MGSFEMGLDLVEGGLDFPAFVVETGKFLGRCLDGI
jgi:hypothetical protein